MESNVDKLINLADLAFVFILTIATAAVFILFAFLLCSQVVAVIATVFAIGGAAMVMYDKLSLIE